VSLQHSNLLSYATSLRNICLQTFINMPLQQRTPATSRLRMHTALRRDMLCCDLEKQHTSSCALPLPPVHTWWEAYCWALGLGGTNTLSMTWMMACMH
jgi:hypothetical protein